jgi:hypothetical protein
MTTYVTARDVIVAHIQPNWIAEYPNVPIYYEDTTAISLDSLSSNFLLVFVNMTNSIRQALDSDPITKTFGVVNLRLFSKEGGGVRKVLGMMDYLTGLMRYKGLVGVTLETPTPGRKQSRDGWTSSDLDTGFYFWQ